MKDEDHRTMWSWLHLSDIHFRHGGVSWGVDQEDVLAQLVSDLSRSMSAPGIPTPDAILITGDIGFSGGAVHSDEYQRALSFVESLRSVIDSDVSVYCVPGNHDVQRTSPGLRSEYRLVQSLRDRREVLDEVLMDENDAAVLHARFANYNAFCGTVGAPVSAVGQIFWTSDVESPSGLVIRLSGLNTAVLSNDDGDMGKLHVGRSASAKALNRSTEQHVSLVLGHHPTDWLEQEDGRYLSVRLFRDSDVYLHGHVHAPDSIASARGSGQRCIIVTAGAVHAEEDRGAVQTPHAYNLAAIMESKDGTRHLRVWPRRWSTGQARWVADTDSLPAEEPFITLAMESAPSDLVEAKAEKQLTLRKRAEDLTAAVGRRRTAYPTDVSISELFDQNLVVPASFLASATRGGRISNVDELIVAGNRGSVLVLGEPGAGKTVIAYELSRRLLDVDPDACPLLIDISARDWESPTLEDLVGSLASPPAETQELGRFVSIVVDGVDEALAAGVTSETIAGRLEALSELARLYVFCRRGEYESQLASYIPDGMFDLIRYVREWGIDQFEEFVGRLVSADLLSNDELVGKVIGNDALTELVRRPLRARMLTFLAGHGELPNDTTSLYVEYMSRLASVVDGRVRAIGCSDMPSTLSLWRSIAWQVFRTSSRRADALPPERLFALATIPDAAPECTSRMLSGVIDIPTGQDARFIHYSFFEFLVAQHLAIALVSALPDAPESAADLLRVDLPLEIRRHLVRLLKRTVLNVHDWPRHLSSVYQFAAELRRDECLVVRNLTAYISCRLDVPADAQLRALLDSEEDSFSRNSLFWALTRCNNMDACMEYLRELGSDQRLASLNRGYLLYYYGDLRTSVPPYADDVPHVAWNHTRETLNLKYDDADTYAMVPAARRAVDVFTFCDIAEVRSQSLTVPEVARFEELLVTLGAEGVPNEIVDLLGAKLDQVDAS